MKLLLDTHVWVWSQEDASRLGRQTRRVILDPEHENYICAISTLELARLEAVGNIRLSIALHDWIARALQAIHARIVQISHEVAMEAYALPGGFHKDPADRLLVGAARCHELTILTADERILGYDGVSRRDARE